MIETLTPNDEDKRLLDTLQYMPSTKRDTGDWQLFRTDPTKGENDGDYALSYASFMARRTPRHEAPQQPSEAETSGILGDVARKLCELLESQKLANPDGLSPEETNLLDAALDYRAAALTENGIEANTPALARR